MQRQKGKVVRVACGELQQRTRAVMRALESSPSGAIKTMNFGSVCVPSLGRKERRSEDQVGTWEKLAQI